MNEYIFINITPKEVVPNVQMGKRTFLEISK